MVEELKKRILNEIKKSGHPLEVDTALKLNKQGWFVTTNPMYGGEGSEKVREVDIVAQKGDGQVDFFDNILVIECKKSSSKPWVFFKQEKKLKDFIGIHDVFVLNVVPQEVIYSILRKHLKNHYYSKFPLCTYHIVPFANNDRSEIFNALSQVLNAIGFYYDQEHEFYTHIEKKRMKLLHPIIVFEGNLFSATFKGGDIKLEDENHILLYLTREIYPPAVVTWEQNRKIVIKTKPIIIDVVKKEYFEKFLDNFQ